MGTLNDPRISSELQTVNPDSGSSKVCGAAFAALGVNSDWKKSGRRATQCCNFVPAGHKEITSGW